MTKKAIAILATILCAAAALVGQSKGGLVDGGSWAYLVSAPAGWVMDAKALRTQGIQGLFYKEGARFSASVLHIYIQPTEKRAGGPSTLSAFMKADEDAYMDGHPGIVVRDLPTYANAMDYSYPMREYDDSEENYYQTLAYYDAQDCYFIFVLFCRSPEERSGETNALLQVLDSFTYMRKE